MENNELERKNEEIEELQKIWEKNKQQIALLEAKLNEEVQEKYNAMAEAVEIRKELEEKEAEIIEMRKEIERLTLGQTETQRNLELQKIIEDLSKQTLSLSEESKNLQKILNEQLNKNEILKQTNEQLERSQKRIEEQERQINLLNCRLQENNRQMIMQSAKDANENSSALILGGNWGLSTYLLDSFSQCWKELKITLPNPILSFGTAIVNGEIYIFGGYSNQGCEKCCYKLKNNGSWMELASLNEERAGISNSSVVYCGNIWVIGGYSGSQSLKSVEKYNRSQNKWNQMPELNEDRGNAAAAVFKNKIIVAGGRGSKTAEIFDATLQRWTIFCDLPYLLVRHCMRITDSILTIYGGWSGRTALKNIWEMDINDPEKKWTEKKELKYARRDFGIAKFSNVTVAFGGDVGDSQNRLDSTEIFDGNNWTEGPKLPKALSDFAYTEIPRAVEERLLKNLL